MYKSPTGIYWRQIMKLEKIDICELLGGWHNAIPLVEHAKNYIFNLLPFLPRTCPFKPGKYYGYNISIDDQIGTEVHKYVTPSLYPNGVYMNIYKFYADDDKEGGYIRAHTDMYDSANADNIMK